MESGIESLSSMSITTLSPLGQQFCPECGAVMIEADRITENGDIFIWYDCSKNDCNGSWLEKIARP